MRKEIEKLHKESNLISKSSRRKSWFIYKLQGKRHILFVRDISNTDNQLTLRQTYLIDRTTVKREISCSGRKTVPKLQIHKLSAQTIKKKENRF